MGLPVAGSTRAPMSPKSMSVWETAPLARSVPLRRLQRNAARLRAMSTLVTTGVWLRRSTWAPDMTWARLPPAQSGQWKPTDAWRMQSGQIGRSQRWQRTPARLPSWR
jgi:hypothetical protein